MRSSSPTLAKCASTRRQRRAHWKFPSQIPDLGFRRRIKNIYSRSSAKPKAPSHSGKAAQASVWPSRRKSSKCTAEKSGLKAKSAKARPLPFRYRSSRNKFEFRNPKQIQNEEKLNVPNELVRIPCLRDR